MTAGQRTGRVPAVLISATHSGAGKTTVTRAVLAALRRRGLVVQPFKVGPDFIDPMYHSTIVGRPSINLDLWMMGEAGVRASFARWSADADVAVIEGMGALFDGADGGDEASAAHLARVLDVPVVVVVDVWGMTRTAAALIDGLRGFDPRMRTAGFVLNRVGSEPHEVMLRHGLGSERWATVVAALRADPGLEVAERHLGLVTTHENPGFDDHAALERAAARVDVDRLVDRLDGRVPGPHGLGASAPPPSGPRGRPRVRLAVARDAAFCFYYEETLRALADRGVELAEFSPVAGDGLPAGAGAVYLGGGYPESFADALAANSRLRADLRAAAAGGVPVYGECGGFMYLARSLRTFDGATHEMSGVLPVDVAMDRRRLAIRYVEVTTRHDTLLGPAGTVARGHEFHCSHVEAADLEPDLFDGRTSDGDTFVDGYRSGSVVAGYTHLHLASAGEVLDNVVAAAAGA